MKSLRLALAAAAVVATVAPMTASAGIQCTPYWTDEQIGPIEYRQLRCAW